MVAILFDLPTEILLNICSYLRRYDLTSFGLTCKDMYALTEDPKLWYDFFKEEVGNVLPFESCPFNLRSIYMEELKKAIYPDLDLVKIGESNLSPVLGDFAEHCKPWTVFRRDYLMCIYNLKAKMTRGNVLSGLFSVPKTHDHMMFYLSRKDFKLFALNADDMKVISKDMALVVKFYERIVSVETEDILVAHLRCKKIEIEKNDFLSIVPGLLRLFDKKFRKLPIPFDMSCDYDVLDYFLSLGRIDIVVDCCMRDKRFRNADEYRNSGMMSWEDEDFKYLQSRGLFKYVQAVVTEKRGIDGFVECFKFFEIGIRAKESSFDYNLYSRGLGSLTENVVEMAKKMFEKSPHDVSVLNDIRFNPDLLFEEKDGLEPETDFIIEQLITKNLSNIVLFTRYEMEKYPEVFINAINKSERCGWIESHYPSEIPKKVGQSLVVKAYDLMEGNMYRRYELISYTFMGESMSKTVRKLVARFLMEEDFHPWMFSYLVQLYTSVSITKEEYKVILPALLKHKAMFNDLCLEVDIPMHRGYYLKAKDLSVLFYPETIIKLIKALLVIKNPGMISMNNILVADLVKILIFASGDDKKIIKETVKMICDTRPGWSVEKSMFENDHGFFPYVPPELRTWDMMKEVYLNDKWEGKTTLLDEIGEEKFKRFVFSMNVYNTVVVMRNLETEDDLEKFKKIIDYQAFSWLIGYCKREIVRKAEKAERKKREKEERKKEKVRKAEEKKKKKEAIFKSICKNFAAKESSRHLPRYSTPSTSYPRPSYDYSGHRLYHNDYIGDSVSVGITKRIQSSRGTGVRDRSVLRPTHNSDFDGDTYSDAYVTSGSESSDSDSDIYEMEEID